METFVRQYVLLRNTIIADEKEMQTRWFPGGMMNFLSSDYVFGQFSAYRDSIWSKIIDAEMVREVEIISIGKLGGRKKSGLEGGLQNLRPLDHHAQSEYPGFDSEHTLLTASGHGLFPPRPRVWSVFVLSIRLALP